MAQVGKLILTDDFGVREVHREIAPSSVGLTKFATDLPRHTLVLRRVADDDVSVEIDGVAQQLS